MPTKRSSCSISHPPNTRYMLHGQAFVDDICYSFTYLYLCIPGSSQNMARIELRVDASDDLPQYRALTDESPFLNIPRVASELRFVQTK